MYQETPILNLNKYNRKVSQKMRQKKSSDGAKDDLALASLCMVKK